MNVIRKLIEKINGNTIARNLVLAFCAIIVFVFVVSILLNLFTRHNSYKAVPDFSGMAMEEAMSAARKASLNIEVNDSLFVPAYDGGIILDQTPAPGAEVKSGRRIFVTVNSYTQKMVEVPYVTGFSLRQAKNNLEVAGLEIDKLIYQDDIATNYILEQRYQGKPIYPGSKLKIEAGSGLTLIVGRGADATYPTTPKLVGFPLKEAKSRLWEMGLNIGTVAYDPEVTLLNQKEARVYMQSPEQGRRVEPGSIVTLKLTLDPEKVDRGSHASDRAAKSIVATQEQSETE